MKTKLGNNNKTITSMGIALILALSATAFADGTTQTGVQGRKHHHHKYMRKVREACAKANGITLPAKGSGQQLSSADRTELHSCFQEYRQDFKSCLQSAGVSKPEPGQKPSAADQAAFKQCGSQALSEISASGSSSSGSN